MSRPKKFRKVCQLPEVEKFIPSNYNEKSHITMSVDEYETIRLIDLEKMTQQECAENMGVARTTVQAIYDSARSKLSDFLVNGRALLITGGEYKLCDGGNGCKNASCRNRRGKCQNRKI